MKVRTIDNLRQLTNALLLLNLVKERLTGNIVLKCSFQMALVSVNSPVNDKLARQNILCFINSISILVVLTYCYHYSYLYSYYSYYHCYFYHYYHYYYYFIVIIVGIIIVLSIINVNHFILFNFISYRSYYYDFYLRVVCDGCVSPRIFFSSFLVNDLHFIFALLIHVKNHFSFVIIVYIIIVIITIIL